MLPILISLLVLWLVLRQVTLDKTKTLPNLQCANLVLLGLVLIPLSGVM